jgi:hypothetical protein
MLTHAFAERFARDWIAAWNSHDLDAILAHYEDGFELATPYIAITRTAPSSRLQGKAAIGAFWAAGLARLPDLHFELLGIFAGTASIALHYRGAQGRTAVEVFEFDVAGKVIRSAAHYAA